MTHKTLRTIRIQSFNNHSGFTNTLIEVGVKNGCGHRFIHRMDRSMKTIKVPLFFLSLSYGSQFQH